MMTKVSLQVQAPFCSLLPDPDMYWASKNEMNLRTAIMRNHMTAQPSHSEGSKGFSSTPSFSVTVGWRNRAHNLFTDNTVVLIESHKMPLHRTQGGICLTGVRKHWIIINILNSQLGDSPEVPSSSRGVVCEQGSGSVYQVGVDAKLYLLVLQHEGEPIDIAFLFHHKSERVCDVQFRAKHSTGL